MSEKRRTCVKCREGWLCSLFTQERIPKREKKIHEYVAWNSNKLILLITFQLNISNEMRFSDKYTLLEKVRNPRYQSNQFLFFFRALCASAAFWLHARSHSPLPLPCRQCDLEETMQTINWRESCICLLNDVVFSVWSSKTPTTCSHLFCPILFVTGASTFPTLQSVQLQWMINHSNIVFKWEFS